MKPELVAGVLLFRQNGALKHLGSASYDFYLFQKRKDQPSVLCTSVDPGVSTSRQHSLHAGLLSYILERIGSCCLEWRVPSTGAKFPADVRTV